MIKQFLPQPDILKPRFELGMKSKSLIKLAVIKQGIVDRNRMQRDVRRDNPITILC